MNSIYIANDSDSMIKTGTESNDYKIMINGKDGFIKAEDGGKILGELAPFFLNPIQQAFHQYYDGGNAVIATPTGSGKTVVAFMAMQKKLKAGQKIKRTIYLSPTRALARQVYQDLKETKFRIYLRTGENKMDVKDNFDIVVATPEAYLASRHSNSSWTQVAELIIIDEAHMLVQNSRGIVYEECIVHAMGDKKTLFLLSATMPDALEMANWIDASLLIESDWRPLPLERSFVKISAPSRKNRKKITKSIYTQILEDNIQKGIKTMIIIPSKKSGWYLLEGFEEMGIPVLNRAVPYIKRNLNQNAVVAFHNADIPIEERHDIEKAFKNPAAPLTVLVSTQTLAYGFNSPTDDILIFVKYSPYNDDNLWPTFLDILQFEGRAGRKGHTVRGYGRVLFSTGSRGSRTQEILEEKLKRGLDDQLETALDRSFNVVSQGYSRYFNTSITRELGDIELAALGIMSVDPVRILDTHYKSNDKKKVLRKAYKRLTEIKMLEDDNITNLGLLTASYMLNPEKVSQFFSVIPKTNDGEPDQASFWNRYEATAVLIPTTGTIPSHYPPFLPIFPGMWNVATVSGNFPDTGIMQYGLGTVAMRIGLGYKENTATAMRQRPPAWTSSLPNDMQLVLSFIRQGAGRGFWPDLGENEYQRIMRSLSYGIHPYYSLLTEITGIGSIRAGILSLVAINAGIESDVELVLKILTEEQTVLNHWPNTQRYLQTWYSLQVKWLKDELETPVDISITNLLNLDYQTFQEAVYLVQKEAKEKGKTFYSTPIIPYEKHPLETVEEVFRQKHPGSSLFILPDAQKHSDKDSLYTQSITLVGSDSNGNIKGKVKLYAPGRLPPAAILDFIPHSEPFLATDTRKYIWVD
ncbi:MAG: DEAD/DEAH box helicase [Thermotogota bacterium]|nr:DEAD/DEAH box helicase [Thermotogota bacterium]